MLYVKFDGEIPVDASYDPPKEKSVEHEGHDGNGSPIAFSFKTVGDEWQTRNDWKSFEVVERIARLLTITTTREFIPVDQGDYCHPRYDVIEPPKVGDEVSRTINGDYYPDGTITKVTKQHQVTTSTGNRYFRRGKTASWVKTGGHWLMVKGHRDERNPHI